MRRRASPGCSTLPDTAALLAAYLGERWGPVAISGVRRFHGGSSRETLRFDCAHADGSHALVLRRDLPASLIETDRTAEFRALQTFHGSAVPVPEPLFLDTGTALGAPGFIMREAADVRAAGLMEADPYGADAGAVGAQMFTILGHIHGRNPACLADVLPAATHPAAERLAHWAAVIDADALGPEPIVRAAIRWLQRHLPPPPLRQSIVHGDYRSGNFLVDAANRIVAVVDWEMVHLGDAHEDLAWAMDPLWAHGSDRPGGTIAEADAIATWEAASGLACNAPTLHWWRVYAQVMGLAIWISSAREVADGRSVDPVLMFAGLYPYRFHNATLARTLAGL